MPRKQQIAKSGRSHVWIELSKSGCGDNRGPYMQSFTGNAANIKQQWQAM
jgi:hypothetical protein